ncbi:hypothetical protein ACRAWF_24710 [Streptomyces sp. L7]
MALAASFKKSPRMNRRCGPPSSGGWDLGTVLVAPRCAHLPQHHAAALGCRERPGPSAPPRSSPAAAPVPGSAWSGCSVISVLDFVGNVSYGWYLTHQAAVAGALGFVHHRPGLHVRGRMRVVVLSFLMAVLLHYAVERKFKKNTSLLARPGRRLHRRIHHGGHRRSDGSLATLIR